MSPSVAETTQAFLHGGIDLRLAYPLRRGDRAHRLQQCAQLGRFGLFSHVALTTGYLVLICAIIWIVLAKPHIDSNEFAPGLFKPGALRQLFSDIKTPIP